MMQDLMIRSWMLLSLKQHDKARQSRIEDKSTDSQARQNQMEEQTRQKLKPEKKI